MKKLESKKQLYVQPETEVLDMKFQTSLLGSSLTEELDCDTDVCEGCYDDF